jgi:hypothetical protein
MNITQLRHIFGVPFLGLMIVLNLSTLSAMADTPPGLAENYLFVTTSEYDFSGGNYDLVNAVSPWESYVNQGAVCADNSLRYENGLIYLINRVGCDNIQVIDPELGFETILQFTTGSGSNPADICFFSSSRAFITRYDTHELWEVDPSSGEHTDTIDLSPFADVDGIPEMFGLAISGDRLYVAIQRLNRNNGWLPAGGSCLAVIDLADNTIIDIDPGLTGLQGIELTGQNPNSWIHIDPATGYFLIAELGFYGVNDGGIEIIDPVTELSLGFAITEEILGGDIYEWDSADDGTGFASILSPSWTPSIVAFDLNTGSNRGVLITSSEFAYRNLMVDDLRRQLFIADRTYADPGILVYNIDTLFQQNDGPIATGLYPHYLLLIEGPATSVNDPAPLTEESIRIWPQPASTELRIQYQAHQTERISVDILDVSGRRITRLADQQFVTGETTITWNGTNQLGISVEAGTYFARITTARRNLTQTLRWIN